MPDSLGLYTTFDSLYDREISPLGFVAEPGGLPVAVLYVTGTKGRTRLRAVSTTEVVYEGVDGTAGEAVELTYGIASVVTADNPDERVRVVLLSEDPLTIGSYLALDSVEVRNGPVGGPEVNDAERLTGSEIETHLALVAHAAVSDVSIWISDSGSDHALAISFDGDSWNTGTDQGTGLTVASMTEDEVKDLYIRRTLEAEAPAGRDYRVAITVEWTSGEGTFKSEFPGLFGVQDDSLEGYVLYLGEDDEPDLEGEPAEESATLPFTTALTPPDSGTKVYKAIVRRRNRYGLQSLNHFSTTIEIDDTGNPVLPDLSAPEDIEIVERPGGYVDVLAAYSWWNDDEPATHWSVYVSDDGSDPLLTDPIVLPMYDRSGLTDSRYGLRRTFGPYAFGTELAIVVRVRRGEGEELVESENTEAESHTITTHAPEPVTPNLFFGTAFEQEIKREAALVIGEMSLILSHTETRIEYDGTVLLRLRAPDSTRAGIYLGDLIEDDTDFGEAEGGDLLELDETDLFVVVGGYRKAKLDLTTGAWSAAEFVNDEAPDVPLDTPWGNDELTTLPVYSDALGRWIAGLAVTSSGQLIAPFDLRQRD